MAYPKPPASKSAVRKAGRAIADHTATAEDIALVDQWRASHGYVINTFQAWIKGHIAKQELWVEFAQRLKRRNTVIDKLLRTSSSGVPLIKDVTGMHDFAGCRMIFDDLAELTSFREYLHSSGVMRNVEHELRHSKDKYDYINSPKPSGYRGIHDVYRHYPRGSKRLEAKKPWDGLLVEIQYRTRAQHAWATAVEISDLLDGEKTKFELDRSARGLFFALASELIARTEEKLERAFLDRSTNEIRDQLMSLEKSMGILRRLELLKQFEVEEKLTEHSVLSIVRDQYGDFQLDIISFRSAAPAILKATELEESGESVNAVYVRSENPKQLRSAYRNYFYDPVDFVELLRAA
ncbi:RelA/SpoT domain-containing protein [Yoonia sp. 2307UL14-13]|uniref:RelA/SpoT domain-containing protein n=1 Tax=Yoonia sp. 2307UL14-13 TaxID=3126506 RepID=UPI003095C996